MGPLHVSITNELIAFSNQTYGTPGRGGGVRKNIQKKKKKLIAFSKRRPLEVVTLLLCKMTLHQHKYHKNVSISKCTSAKKGFTYFKNTKVVYSIEVRK